MAGDGEDALRGARTSWLLCAGALLATLVPGAAAGPPTLPQLSGRVDLLRQANVKIDGARARDLSFVVAAAGDVNGDGRSDVVVGARRADNNRRTNSGSAYVVFGRKAQGRIDLARLGRGGFRIDGAAAGDFAGFSVAGAGDVNQDGLADVIVGAPGANARGRNAAGAAYTVFGRRSTSSVDLRRLGSRGIRLDGAAAGDYAGTAVAGAGDVDGDGRPDVVIGAYGADGNGRADAGGAFVVFGRAAGRVDLAALGAGGFRIDGPVGVDADGFADRTGSAVAGAGDVDGDGRDDVLVGAPGADLSGRTNAGAAYLVFGRAGTAAVDLARDERSVWLLGAATDAATGTAVAGAGDVDGDGRGDVLVGAPGTADDAGAAYLVLGRSLTRPLDLGARDWEGVRIAGAAAGDAAGIAVSAAGDVNGDGRRDVLVGAIGTDHNRRSNSGSVYVVYGSRSGADVDLGRLGRLGRLGLRADGSAANNHTGWSVAGGGDLNGDGRADVLAGAEGADDNGRSGSGVVYAVYGFRGL